MRQGGSKALCRYAGTLREQEESLSTSMLSVPRIQHMKAGRRRHSAPASYRVQYSGRGNKRCTVASDCFDQPTLVRFSSLPSMVSCSELLLVWALKLMFMLL